MIESAEADVLVVGAGPAGAAAACTASAAGLRVLLADDPVARPTHEIMVSSSAAARLARLGIEVAARRVDLAELCFPVHTARVDGTGAGVADSGSLRAGLIAAARAAGAGFISTRVTDVSPHPGDGHTVQTADGTVMHARHVINAAGSASAAEGIACARRFGGIGVVDRILLAPVTPDADPRTRPGMVTVLPGGDGTATIWLTRLGGPASDRTGGPAGGRAGGPVDEDPEAQLADALADLARRDKRFTDAYPLGPAASGWLAVGFSPHLLAGSRALIAGDAAGLQNPFTGEGLSPALLSGTLAAEAIARHRADADAAREDYIQRLSAEYVGYFETTRHAARRYHLVWRMLEGAAASEHIFLTRARRAILMPEGRAADTQTRVTVAHEDRAVTGPFLFACDEVQISTLRVQWPFLARLLVDGSGLSRHRLRSGLLFLAGLLAERAEGAEGAERAERAEGRDLDLERATQAAAIELASFGALAFIGAEEPQRPVPRGVDWAGATLVLAGDFLLSQASRLIGDSAPELSWSFADWLGELAELRAERLGANPGKASVLHASLMEFPLRAGALLAGGADQTVATLRGTGRALGEAFAHAEDVIALSGRRTRLDATLAGMVSSRISAISEVTATAPDLVRDRLADPAFRAAALAASRLACAGALRRARATIADVPGEMARRVLLACAAAIEPEQAGPAVTAPRERRDSGQN